MNYIWEPSDDGWTFKVPNGVYTCSSGGNVDNLERVEGVVFTGGQAPPRQIVGIDEEVEWLQRLFNLELGGQE